MRIFEHDQLHLGYCTNIHPGETLSEITAALLVHTSRVRNRICPDRALGIGLRLSNEASIELADEIHLREFSRLLESLGLYVFSINGFPFGPFHQRPLKEGVYDPDWTTDARADYTRRLSDILSRLVPPGVLGTISTVPGCFRPLDSEPTREKIASALVEQAAYLYELERRQGTEICLALEPEPHCLLETCSEARQFFNRHLAEEAASRLAALLGISAAAARTALRRHVGVCLDACHAAVEFEEPEQAIEELMRAGVRIAKLQISCGLKVQSPSAEQLWHLSEFEDSVYLHQTVVKRKGALRRYLDLPLALAEERLAHHDESAQAESEWRVHYHVPIFESDFGPVQSTQSHLRRVLALQKRHRFSTHLEVETYTWDVLPERYRNTSIDEAIARELSWVLKELAAP